MYRDIEYHHQTLFVILVTKEISLLFMVKLLNTVNSIQYYYYYYYPCLFLLNIVRQISNVHVIWFWYSTLWLLVKYRFLMRATWSKFHRKNARR